MTRQLLKKKEESFNLFTKRIAMPGTEKNVYTVINPQNGHLLFKLFSFEDNSHFDHVQRLNYYSVILLQQGTVKLNADFSEYIVSGPCMFFFSPYQPFMLSSEEHIKGMIIHFHSDFFCIHKHDQDIACNGVLFNNIYKPPFIQLLQEEEGQVLHFIEGARNELQHSDLAREELLVSYLKIVLIHCSRIKVKQEEARNEWKGKEEPILLQHLREAIEQHYRQKHGPADYAALMNISAKALAKLTKNHFDKTLSEMIAERIVIEAKRELYLSSKPVKLIAYELGFDDEYYFSRFFKKNTSVSPQLYRETVGFAKGELRKAI
jgi:AraC-like DNA-binding protein